MRRNDRFHRRIEPELGDRCAVEVLDQARERGDGGEPIEELDARSERNEGWLMTPVRSHEPAYAMWTHCDWRGEAAPPLRTPCPCRAWRQRAVAVRLVADFLHSAGADAVPWRVACLRSVHDSRAAHDRPLGDESPPSSLLCGATSGFRSTRLALGSATCPGWSSMRARGNCPPSALRRDFLSPWLMPLKMPQAALVALYPLALISTTRLSYTRRAASPARSVVRGASPIRCLHVR